MTKTKKRSIIIALNLLLVGVLVTYLANNRQTFRAVVESIQKADLSYLILASIALALSQIASTMSYYMLRYKTLRVSLTMLANFASGLSGKLLPAGVGGPITMLAYLKAHNHKYSESAAVATANSIMGILSALIIMICIGPLLGRNALTEKLSTSGFILISFLFAITIVSLLLLALKISATRRIVYPWISKLAKIRTTQLIWSLIWNIMITICLSVALWLCARSIGAEIALQHTAIAVLASSLGAAIVPTPGGIGGSEGGMVAVFQFYGLDLNSALTVATLYRGVVSFVALALGLPSITLLRRKWL